MRDCFECELENGDVPALLHLDGLGKRAGLGVSGSADFEGNDTRLSLCNLSSCKWAKLVAWRRVVGWKSLTSERISSLRPLM